MSVSAQSNTSDEREIYASGDSYLYKHFLPLEINWFQHIDAEVEWKAMISQGHPVPRSVVIQADHQTDSEGYEWLPIYRHPIDSCPPTERWTTTVLKIKALLESKFSCTLNHCLLQKYVGKDSSIGEHCDKTLDIHPETSIFNVSLGAQRTFRLRQKRNSAHQRTIQKVPLPNGSVFVMGPQTNKQWLHGIRRDRRNLSLKTPPDRAYHCQRISLTFRTIATFHQPKTNQIKGQGALHEVRSEDQQGLELLSAFALENHQSNLTYQELYGKGYSILTVPPT